MLGPLTVEEVSWAKASLSLDIDFRVTHKANSPYGYSQRAKCCVLLLHFQS